MARSSAGRGQAHLVEVDDRDLVADQQLVDVEVAVRGRERQPGRQLAAEAREQRVDPRAQRRQQRRDQLRLARRGAEVALGRRGREVDRLRALQLGGERAGRRGDLGRRVRPARP